METRLSDCDSVIARSAVAPALDIRPVRSTAPLLMLGMLLTAAALMMPHVHVRDAVEQPAVLQSSHVEAVVVTPRPIVPSAFDREAAMKPSQLMGRWDDLISKASRKFHVPQAWIRAVMQRESGGRTMMAPGRPIVSRAGALGLMQVLPETYDEMAAQYRLGADPFDAQDNIFAGAAYLRWLHRKYGYPAMFAAYNAGPGRVDDHLQHGARLPAETRAYVGHITSVLGKGKPAHNALLVKFTRPDGRTIRVDAAKVDQVRAPLPGEYDGEVSAVIKMGDRYQAIRENLEIARSAIRAVGGLS
ncbi:MAG: hypothetical protein BGN85_11705 [Alphaproteobacteria bacterium 64-11]|nr:MAG: hypothetical protein BGN85_11705 [Alphaproteobacteria bacterium 64-11]